ncbi:MAG: AAA family ATPase, partial [Chloroflexota bacterium]
MAKHLHSVRGVLSTYLPRYLVIDIQKDPRPGRVSGGFHYGAVLFADVSGFTAMSEKLSVLGKEGAEEVTSIVNDYFTAMLEINDQHGGDLLKFGGDALLIFFEGHLGPHKALATGKAMMEAMARFSQVKTSQGVFPLRMKIGMACGSVFLASLGTPQSMDHAVMGSTLYKMAQSENNATAGEIVVHGDVREVTKEIATYSPLVDGFWKLDELHHTISLHDESAKDSKSLSADTGYDPDILAQDLFLDADIIGGLQPFVPQELLTRIITDPQQTTVYGSHRPVTITFTNFLGIDEIIESLGQAHADSITSILNRHFITMSEVITRFGGTVNRLDAYSKGHRILGLFGALQAHEDDPQRAVRAGLEMNNALDEVNLEAREILKAIPDLKEHFASSPLKQRIGINTGFVFGCNTGSRNRREYTVMGDQVNLTARLMGIAEEGEVLIGQTTARQAEEIFHLQEKEAVKVKGKTDPVRNFVVTGIKERVHWKTRLATSPIIGRDEELQIGREAIEAALKAQARVLVISGVSGMGKTRLAEELAWYADQQGMNLLVGTCLSYGKSMTYHPWAEVLREIFGISASSAEQDSRSRVEAVQRGMESIDEGLWAPLIGDLLGLEIGDNDLTRDLDPKLRRQRALDLTVQLLKAMAHSHPLMLVIEDAHWADPASMDLIDYVARNISGSAILFMLPHRPDIGLPDWTSFSHAAAMELTDLPDIHCREIIADITGGVQLPEAMYEVILSRGCGNPFFIEEVCRALVESGAVYYEHGEWQRISMDELQIPQGVQVAVEYRLTNLPKEYQDILRMASIIGREFSFEILSTALDMDEDTIIDGLEAA